MDKTIEKVKIPELLKVSDKTEITKEDIDKLSPKLKLLVDPLYYAACAIKELERQLETKVSFKKRNRIQHRIASWIEAKNLIMEHANAKENEETNTIENQESSTDRTAE